MKQGSLRTRFLVGSILWTLGLLGVSHLLFNLLIQFAPHILMIRHWTTLSILTTVFILNGLSQVRRNLTPVNQLRARLSSVREGREQRVGGDYPTEV